MFNFLFGLLEVLGLIGVARACVAVHDYCLNHAWTNHTTEEGAWKIALIYALCAIILFWLAHLSANSIYLLVFGFAGGGLFSVGLLGVLAVVICHVVYGGLFVIPYLARGLAFLSSHQ